MNDLDALRPLLLPLLLVAGVIVWVAFGGLRRGYAIRDRMLRQRGEHERILSHAQYRVDGQKAHAAALRSTGDEKVAHLWEAIRLFRLAIQTRLVDDRDTYEMLRRTVDSLEDELRAEGVDPDV
ncbi:MAG: hypothetical protein IT204_19445 [Fimbriimonadaceae bacterium]|nr:hypothetical protein [Fimbriimonadaceae bacterium]